MEINTKLNLAIRAIGNQPVMNYKKVKIPNLKLMKRRER